MIFQFIYFTVVIIPLLFILPGLQRRDRKAREPAPFARSTSWTSRRAFRQLTRIVHIPPRRVPKRFREIYFCDRTRSLMFC